MHKEQAQTFCDVIEDTREGKTAFVEQRQAWITADSNAVERLETWE